MTKKRGFSLVEILIALALIGIVSVVSIRILSNRDNTLEYTAKRDKVLANMQGLAKEAMYNNLADEITYADLSNALAGLNTDGAGTRDKSSFTIGAGIGDYIASVEIDVNGADKFPNENGRDKFLYYVDRYGNFVRDEIQAGNLMLAGGTSHWDKEQSVKLDKKDISGDKGTTPDNIDGPQDEGVYKDCPDGSKVLTTEECPAAPGKQWCNGVEISALEPCEQNAEVQCWDGSFVANLSQCPPKVTCPDGTFAKNMSECKVQCPDGSWAVTYAQCAPDGGGGIKPPVVTPGKPTPDTKTKTCWDGSVIAVHLPCPAYQDCWDGSRIYKVQTCPTPKYCWDGSVIYEWEDCPPEPIECWDGTIVDAGESCPPETKTCWDGSVVGIDEDCPEKPCEVQTCTDGYTWDSDLCKCVAGGGGDDDCEVQICREGYTWDRDECRCIAPANPCAGLTGLALKACECREGGGVWNEATSSCNTGCVQTKSCRSGYSWDSITCDCIKDPTPTCPPGSYYDKKTGMCKEVPCCDNSNPAHISGAEECRICDTCVEQTCGKSQIWNDETCQCEKPVCDDGYAFDEFSGECVRSCKTKSCGSGYEWSSDDCACKKINCGPNKEWSVYTNRCECVAPLVAWADGTCRRDTSPTEGPSQDGPNFDRECPDGSTPMADGTCKEQVTDEEEAEDPEGLPCCSPEIVDDCRFCRSQATTCGVTSSWCDSKVNSSYNASTGCCTYGPN